MATSAYTLTGSEFPPLPRTLPPRARRRGRRLARPMSSKGAGGPLPSSVLLGVQGGYGILGAKRRVRRPGSLVPEPLGSRPAEQIDPLLHELGQTAGIWCGSKPSAAASAAA